jgi:predicted enzyme related to lactoylglutathione lyase
MPDSITQLKIAYLELPANDMPATQSFYGTLFGWTFQNWGPTYATVHGSGLESGIHADPTDHTRSRAPLAIIESHDLEATEQAVRTAGGKITLPIFNYPGGRRFHFTDPSGNELAVMQPDSQH